MTGKYSCLICGGGELRAGPDAQYFKCVECKSEVAKSLTPRPASEYELIEWYGPRWEFNLVAGQIAEGVSIIEIGCGEGFFSKALTQRKIRYQGVDFNSQAIETAKKTAARSGVDFYTCLDEASSSADVLCAFHVIEHLPSLRQTLTELIDKYEVKAIFASVPNPVRATVRASMREEWDNPPHHLYRFSEKGMRKLFEDLGFERTVFAYEPLRDEEIFAIANAKIPDWLPHKRKLLRLIQSLTGKIPPHRRPGWGQAMLMGFRKRA